MLISFVYYYTGVFCDIWILLYVDKTMLYTGVVNGESLKDSAEGCTGLERLLLAYVGLGSNMATFWDCIQYFKQLKDLR